MGLLLVVVVAAAAAGWSVAAWRGRPPGRLADLRLRGRHLVLLALLAQVLGALLGGPAYALALGASAVLATGFLARNRGLAGTGLLLLGLAANGLVVAANGAMPVALGAAARAGVPPRDLTAVVLGVDPRHALSGPGTRLPLLGDVVPVPLPLYPQVVSPGDVLVAAGLGQLVLTVLSVSAGPGRRARGGQAPAPRRAVPRDAGPR